MKNRSIYWSCTKIADLVRGTPKLDAGTSKEWRDWEKSAKAAHPVRYWIAEEALDAIQNFINYIPDKLYDVKYYINNRYISRTHSLTANSSNIRPGTWCDMGNRILPCLFDELVNFVEVELAWKNIAWDKNARKKYYTPFYATGWFRWRTWRSAQAGLDYLTWEQTLVLNESWGVDPSSDDYGKPTHQGETAKEIETLYRWYKEIYPNRPDSHDASGWTEYCSKRRADENSSFWDMSNETDEEQAESRRILDRCNEIEKQYFDEDTEMLTRLIKVRNSLWT